MSEKRWTEKILDILAAEVVVVTHDEDWRETSCLATKVLRHVLLTDDEVRRGIIRSLEVELTRIQEQVVLREALVHITKWWPASPTLTPDEK